MTTRSPFLRRRLPAALAVVALPLTALVGCGQAEQAARSSIESELAKASEHLLDSEARWNHPPMWACSGCGHSIAELAAGLNVPDGEHVEWVALAARCVECGRLAGLTDAVVDRAPLTEVLAQL